MKYLSTGLLIDLKTPLRIYCSKLIHRVRLLMFFISILDSNEETLLRERLELEIPA